MSGELRNPLRQCVESPWLTLSPILVAALIVRLWDLDAFGLWGDEPLDIPASMLHVETPNPFKTTEWLARADPSQARLPYYLTGVGIWLLSETDASAFWIRGGRVEGSPQRAWATIGVVIGLLSLTFLIAAPPLGRWAVCLPAFFAALVLMILGPPKFPTDQLVAARAVAAVIGVCGIVATYGMTRAVVDHWAGLLAAGIVALTPILVGWNRCAVTIGDSFITTFLTLAVWALYRAIHCHSGRAMMCAAAAMGLAFGAKISAVLLWPIGAAYALLSWLETDPTPTGPSDHRAGRRLLMACILHVALLLPLALVFFWPSVVGPGSAEARLEVWSGALAVYVAGFAWLMRSGWTLGRHHLFGMVICIWAGGAIVAAFSTPYHLRMEAIDGLVKWWHEFGARPGEAPNVLLDLWSMGQIVMIYLKLPVNVLAVMGLVAACRRSHLGTNSLFLLTITVYLVAVALLHQKASYYVLPVLPIFVMFAAGMFVRISRAVISRGFLGAGAVAAAVLSLGALQTVRLHRLHPHYLLDGLEWQRRLYFGPKLKPANLQFQAARSAVAWLTENAPPRSRVAVALPAHAQRFPGLAVAAIAFEVQRLPEARDKAFVYRAMPDRNELGGWDFVVFFPVETQAMPAFPCFRQVHIEYLRDVPAALIFQRQATP